ncbi:MAG: ATP-binding cassette domain-containing protein [Saprospiraceae bacterium]|nr:ATP-binding cassette domain-containing protein [Saprospiraceae bacterium]
MNDSIRVDSVFLDFGTKPILRGISLEIIKNQVVGILGRNGCGKSCLLKITTGQIQPPSKHLEHNGKVMDDLYKEKGLINYLPQHEFHPKSLTIKDLLRLYEIDQDHFFDEYSFLKAKSNSRFSNMSGGERRILEVLLVLESKSEFSILDEPFTHVMPKYVDLLKERISKIKSRKGMVITDHQFRNVLDISDRSYLIYEGNMREIKEAEDLRSYGYIR